MSAPRIVRLNGHSIPMAAIERETLAPLSARIIEIEGGTDTETLAACAEADAILIIATYLPAAVIKGLNRCRIISRLGTGVDKIDIPAATAAGIIVNNLPDAFTEEVADHTMALLLSAARRLPDMDQAMRQGRRPSGTHGIHRLSAQTVGLLGFGRIGKAVAKRCQAFGIKVLVFDPYLDQRVAQAEGVEITQLDELLVRSDYVCPLCPLTPETKKLLGRPQYERMKRTAFLINTGRGECTDEDALAEALQKGLIAGAALDVFGVVNVFTADGFPTKHPLFTTKGVQFTPHIAAISEEADYDVRRRGCQAVVDVLSGRWSEHPVDPKVQPRFGTLSPR